MSNLYRLDANLVELARQFGVEQAPDLLEPSPVQPGKLGLIVRGVSGKRSMHVIKWGFPRPGPDIEPSTVNLVADLTNFMWDGMVPDPRYRCLVPVSALGQPDGPKGFKTRTWFSIPEWPVFALAGFCRTTPEWGPVYAAMTGDSNELVMPLNDRSPIILPPSEYDRWLTAPIEDVIAIQFRKPFPAARMAMERTDELWVPMSERTGRPRPGSNGRVEGLFLGRGDEGDLVYAGAVDRGFTDEDLVELQRRLPKLAVRQPALAKPPKKPKAKWVLPQVMVEVVYPNKSADGRLRLPSFKGLRDDLTKA